MEPRLDYSEVLPDGIKHLNTLDHYSQHSGLEPALLDLIKLRASQINGCAYCIDMHSKDARTGGESEQRLYNLGVWRETPYSTDRERAALALTEAATLIADRRVPGAGQLPAASLRDRAATSRTGEGRCLARVAGMGERRRMP